MTFEQVQGNESAKSLLRHAVDSGRIGHAYILQGKKGVGRMTLARAFASAVLGTDNPDTHPDFTVVTNQLYDPSKKQETVLVDTIRNMKRDVYIRPYAGDHKIYVIPKADTMQAPAQNSLLKVFEEPPGYCTILLLAENANSFLPTILSRAPVLRLHPLDIKQAADFLEKHHALTPQRAEQLAILSGGALGKALDMLEDSDASALREETFRHLMNLLDGGYRALYDLVRFLKQNKAYADFILEILLSWSQDLLYMKIGGTRFQIVNTDKKDQLQTFCGRITRTAAFRFSEITVRYQGIIGQNANYPVAVLCMVTEYWEEIHGRNHRS